MRLLLVLESLTVLGACDLPVVAVSDEKVNGRTFPVKPL